MKFKALTIEKEMYQQALSERMTFNDFLERLEEKDGCKPMNATLDAFERQLKANGIRLTGKQVSLVDDFYKTTSSSALFPEFINRQVRLGMEKARNECLLEDIIATQTEIDSGAYQGIDATIDATEIGGRRVGEGADFPVMTITLSTKSINLKKVGHEIRTSYEVTRRMSVDALGIHLQMVGRRLRRSMIAEALDIIINGDGNSNPAPVTTTTGLTYDNMIDFDNEFDDFEPTVFVATKAGMGTILKMAEFKDPQAGFNYQATGKMVSPFGLTLRRHASVPASKLIAVDKSSALELVRERVSSLVEVDKVISRQLDKAVVSEVMGFKKIYTNASRVWNYA